MSEANLLPEATRFLVTAAALFVAVLIVAVGRSQAIMDRLFPNSTKKKEVTDIAVISAAFADSKGISNLEHSIDKLTVSIDKFCAHQELIEAKNELRDIKNQQAQADMAQAAKGLLDYLRMMQ